MVIGEDPRPIRSLTVDALRVLVYEDERQLGIAAGRAVASELRALLARQARARVVFASAPSQREMWRELSRAQGIGWDRVVAFHMDEYVGLPAGSPGSLGGLLCRELLAIVRPGEVHLIDGSAHPAEECRRYSQLIAEAPIDIACMGIGENGHIAFNEPGEADFQDSRLMKVVRLDPESRQQQVNDGTFASLPEVPERALTLTVPALMAARRIFCVVPGHRKRQAVQRALWGEVSPSCPASILRRHPNSILYLDAGSWGG